MSREIKFRAWDKDHQRMINLGSHGELKYDGESVKIVFGEDFHDDFTETGTHNIELLQYTGTKDKSGREIYEGDILRLDYPNWKQQHVVQFNECVISPLTDDVFGEYWCDAFEGKYEVIGNIYEHPELLKEESNDG